MLDLGLTLVASEKFLCSDEPFGPWLLVLGMWYGVQSQVFLLERSQNRHLMALR